MARCEKVPKEKQQRLKLTPFCRCLARSSAADLAANLPATLPANLPAMCSRFRDANLIDLRRIVCSPRQQRNSKTPTFGDRISAKSSLQRLDLRRVGDLPSADELSLLASCELRKLQFRQKLARTKRAETEANSQFRAFCSRAANCCRQLQCNRKQQILQSFRRAQKRANREKCNLLASLYHFWLRFVDCQIRRVFVAANLRRANVGRSATEFEDGFNSTRCK